MILDSLLSFDILMIILFLNVKIVEEPSQNEDLGFKLRILVLLKSTFAIFSLVPFFISFTRQTLRKIAILRIVLDLAMACFYVVWVYTDITNDLYILSYRQTTLGYKLKFEAKTCFWGCIIIIGLNLLCQILLVYGYCNRTMKLKMIKEGGLSDLERGLVLGMAAGGKSRSSTERLMGMGEPGRK
jgi:hypothetical protein